MMPTKQLETDLCVEQAIRRWTRRHSGTWSDSDEAELRTWLTAAPEHRIAYERIARVWVSAGGLEGRIQRPEAGFRPSRSRQVWAACAAVLAAALIVPLCLFSYNWWNGVPVHWVTQRGEPRAIVLPDGTRVLLDADSDLVVKMGARVRRVALVRGEALFSVVHRATQPFEVEIGRGRIVDLGTRFDVENLHGSARVAVFEGRVGVSTPHGEVLLTAGHGSGYDGAGVLLPVREVDDAAALWPQGQRRFEEAPLSDVVERLMRYHAVTFAFGDPRLKQLRLSGTFRITDLPLFLRTLSAALPVEARWIGPQRVELTARTTAPDQDSRRPVSPGAER
jgi:transmembrane sensor